MSISEIPDTDNPIEHFYNAYYGTNPADTQVIVEQVLWKGEVSLVGWLDENDIAPHKVDEEIAKDFLRDLRRAYSPSTQHVRASLIRKVYSKMCSRGYPGFIANPFEKVLEDHDILDPEYDEDTLIYDKGKIEVFLNQLPPNPFGAMLTEFKTTRRVGGTLNLDLYDANLDHPGADWPVHKMLREKPDHLHFSPRPEAGRAFRGEKREDSAKSETVTVIPIDQQLKDVLIWLLSMRSSLTKYDPLFVNFGDPTANKRMNTNEFTNPIRKTAKRLDGYWYEPYDSDNMRPHYPRHWTTSKMKDKIPDSIVNYMRGDKPDSSDDYNHYTEEKADAWLKHIPQFDLQRDFDPE